MITYKLVREANEPNASLDNSKIFGSPVFPEDFLRKNKLEEDVYFAQINLEELKRFATPLPKEGMLYFFLRFTKYSFKPVVKYTKEDLNDLMEGINEIFEDADLDYRDALYMRFEDVKEEAGYLLGEEDQEIPEHNSSEDIVLLKVDPLGAGIGDFPCLNNPDDEIYFYIKKEDLEALDFSKVKLVFHGS